MTIVDYQHNTLHKIQEEILRFTYLLNFIRIDFIQYSLCPI